MYRLMPISRCQSVEQALSTAGYPQRPAPGLTLVLPLVALRSPLAGQKKNTGLHFVWLQMVKVP